MGAKFLSGSIRKLAIGGVAFRVAADANLSMPVSEWEVTSVPTSGTNLRKMTRRSVNIEGLVLIVDSDELALLKGFAESLDNVTLAVTNAAGDTLRGEGGIHIDTFETEENRCTVNLLPSAGWTTAIGEVS
jgi:hypothetical protein